MALGALLAFATGCGSQSKSQAATRPPAVTRYPPMVVSVAQLTALARSLNHLIFWVGPRAHETLQVTRFSDGGLYVRYLPAHPGAEARDLTIGTYPVADAYATVSRAAAQPGAHVDHLIAGGLGVAPAAHPRNVYMAFPGARLLAEVYDPSPRRAHQLVRTGQILRLAP